MQIWFCFKMPFNICLVFSGVLLCFSVHVNFVKVILIFRLPLTSRLGSQIHRICWRGNIHLLKRTPPHIHTKWKQRKKIINCRKLSHISKWAQQHEHLRDTNIAPWAIFATVNFSFIPLTFAVIIPLCQLLFILLFITFWQHHGLPPPPSHPSRLLAALSLTCELWPAAKALQANAAGAELRVTLLVFLRRMWQHVSQSLVSKKSGFYTVIICWHCEQYKKKNNKTFLAHLICKLSLFRIDVMFWSWKKGVQVQKNKHIFMFKAFLLEHMSYRSCIHVERMPVFNVFVWVLFCSCVSIKYNSQEVPDCLQQIW